MNSDVFAGYTRRRFMVTVTLIAMIVLSVSVSTSVLAQGSEDVEERRARLRSELEQNQKEQQELQGQVNNLRGQERSIERDIQLLEAEIRQAQLKIQQKEIRIQQLGKGINQRTQTIEQLNAQINRSKSALSQLLRETNELDNFSTVEVMLREGDLSDFFTRLDDFDAIQQSLNVSMDEIRAFKKQNREEKQQLSTERDAVQDAKAVIQQQKAQIERKEGKKQELLSIKRSTKKTYQQRLVQKKQRAQQIRTALFALRDSAAIPFGDALRFANQASNATGVRPAFLLAILKQESELGQNVGTCNRPGDPPSKSWREIMPGPEDNSWRDDVSAFKKITNELGRDPNGLPLSCPMYGGWGGAMGPSQFIPATWLQYKPRVESALGVGVADPWEPRHAFTASALYLADLDANLGGYTAERRAALKYYAGSNWNLPKNAFYGNQVMRKAQDIQQNMIDPLQDVE